METNFWLDRWQQGMTGFHLNEVNHHLKKWIGHTQIEAGATIFVPLCGKSIDLLWLVSSGYKVVGVELSPLAAEQFIHENDLQVGIAEIENFTVYTADNLKILCGDFFDLKPEHLDTVSLIYDRAALIALPPEMRKQYVSHMRQLVPVDTTTLLITLDYEQAKMSGPPFSLPEAEIKKYYEEVTLLESNDVLASHQKFKDRGVRYLNESCWFLGKSKNQG